MLNNGDLKTWLHRDLTQRDKLLLLLAAAEGPREIKDLREQALEAGFKIPAKWNPSAALKKSKGQAIRTPKGWEITEGGKQHLRNLGVTKISPAAVQVAVDLRAMLPDIKDDDTRAFVEDAIKCHELELYRPAIVMSWLAAIHVLHRVVCQHHLAAFNVEAKKIDSKWRPAKKPDDIGRLKERDFLERIAALSIISKNTKNELVQCLDRRNGAGHPNSTKWGPNTVAHHLEVLLLNVFEQFE